MLRAVKGFEGRGDGTEGNYRQRIRVSHQFVNRLKFRSQTLVALPIDEYRSLALSLRSTARTRDAVRCALHAFPTNARLPDLLLNRTISPLLHNGSSLLRCIEHANFYPEFQLKGSTAQLQA